MPGSSPASSLSTSVRSALAPSLACILATDRGSTRERNDRTARARTCHFSRWCLDLGFNDPSFAYTAPQEAGQILAAYAQEIAEGKGIKGTSQPDVKTIQAYVRAAASLALSAGFDDPRFLPHVTAKDGGRIYVPLLRQVFDTARKWTPLKYPERQAITQEMLHDLVRRVPSSPGAEFLLPAVTRDAAILGTFTGSRVSEYAQGQLSPGQIFHRVPRNAASGTDVSIPIAFVLADFAFFTADGIQLESTAASSARYLRIRYRYCKGMVRSFAHRMYAAIPAHPLCPVMAASRVVRRWLSLQLEPNTPLFCFLRSSLSRSPAFLLDAHMTAALRASLRRVYPNPRHILRQHESAFSSHSLRVFACLCLNVAGWDSDAIAHQLRWSSDAIKYYVRQSLTQVDAVSASMFQSAHAVASAPPKV